MSSNRILIWTASYPPVLGGLQRVVSQLAEECASRGLEVKVIANRYPRSLKRKEQIHEHLIIHRFIHWNPHQKGFKGLVYKLGAAFLKHRLRNLTRAFSPGKVWVHFPAPQIPYLESVYEVSSDGKWSLSFHGHDVLRFLEQGDDYAYNSLNRNVRPPAQLLEFIRAHKPVLNACSLWLAEKVQLVFDKPCSYIHNAVDLKLVNVKSSQAPFNRPYIFAFGRLDEHKGFQNLIGAYVQVKLNNPQLPTLIIAGDGPYRNHLEELIPVQFKQDILLPGTMELEELYQWGRHAQSIWIPSLREPFGIVALEALWMNNQVFASEVGGLPEAGGAYLTYMKPDVNGVMTCLSQQIVPKEKVDKWNHLKKFSINGMTNQYLNL